MKCNVKGGSGLIRAHSPATRTHEAGNRILDYIEQARLQSGDQLPSEAEMAEQLGISRATIRETYVRLVERGVIVRRHGRGTFVGQVPIKEDQTIQTGFAQSIRVAGFEPSVDILSVERVALHPELAAVFDCAAGTEVSKLLRLFRANGDPVLLIEDCLAPFIDAANIDFDRYGLNLVAGLATQTNIVGSRIDSSATATGLSLEQAVQLGLPEGAPSLHTHSVIRAASGTAICASWAWLNPQMIELKSSRSVTLPNMANFNLDDDGRSGSFARRQPHTGTTRKTKR